MKKIILRYFVCHINLVTMLVRLQRKLIVAVPLVFLVATLSVSLCFRAGIPVAYYYFGICAGIHGAPVIELSGRGTYEPNFSLAGRAVQTMSAVRYAERREMESVGVLAMKRGALLFLCPTNYRKNAIRHLHDFMI